MGDLDYETLIQAVVDTMMVVDRTGEIVSVNAAAGRLFRCTESELIRLRVEDLIPPRLSSRHLDLRRQYHAFPEPRLMGSGLETLGYRRDGSEFAAEVSLSPISGERVLVCIVDITTSKMAEEALRRSETQLRLFIEHSPVALAMFDCNMNYLAVSHRWLQDHELDERDIVGRNHYELFPETSGAWKAIHKRCLSGQVERMVEDRFDRPNRMPQWLRWEARPWKEADGAIGGIVIFTEDVTDRVRDRELIARSEQRFRTTFEQAAVGMGHVALDGHWLRVNQKLCDIVGYSREQLATKTFQSITHPDDLAADLVRAQALLDKEIDHYTLDKRYIRQDGKAVWIRLTGSLARTSDGQADYFIAVVEDIDDRKQAESALRRLRGEFEQVMALQVATQTAAAIAHDLNQPLNAIASYTAAALRLLHSGSPDDARMRHALESAATQAQRAGDVMRELMQFLYKGTPQIEAFDINAAVDEAIANVQARIAPGIVFNTFLEPGLRPALASRMQVERVLVNLLSNSVEAMQCAGVDCKSITISVSTTSLQDMVVITVQDSGPGLDPAIAREAFEPFFTTKDHGLGMGLAVSRSLIVANGGQLWHEDTGQAGATFRFTLPLVA